MAKQPDILFSPSTGGFYLPGISSQVPNDAVAISHSRHAELIEAASQGAQIQAPRGKPVAVTAPISREALAQAVRRDASRRILAISPIWQQMNDLREPGPAAQARFVRIDGLRTACQLIIDQIESAPDKALASFPIADHPLWPLFNEEDEGRD